MTTAGLIAPLVHSTSSQHSQKLGAGEQLQEALELASMGDGQPGKSAWIKSISNSIKSIMACCLNERQQENDEWLRRNLNNPGISRIVLFCESDAPPVPEGTVPVEVVRSDERITYAEWFCWVKCQCSGIGLLLNADIGMDEGMAIST